MWCKNCNIETNEKVCPVCGTGTVEDVPVEIYWCKECATPIIHLSSAADKGICPICGQKLDTYPLISDLSFLRNGYFWQFCLIKSRLVI